jgi:DNA-binding NarL/FixJ family response regulator
VVRVFHCDDSSAFRLLVREMLQPLGGVEFVGDAATLGEALERLPSAAPQVVLIDLFEREQPDALVAQLRAAAPSARMIVYSGMPEDHADHGADEHVHKSVGFDELHRVIVG